VLETIKAPGTMCLKLQCDGLLSSFAFNLKLRPYNTACAAMTNEVGASSKGSTGQGLGFRVPGLGFRV